MENLLVKWMSFSTISRMGLIIFGLLAVATIVAGVLRRVKPQSDFSEVTARVRAWWVMAGIFLAAIAAGRRVSLVFFGLLSFWAMKEYITLLKTRPTDHRALFWLFVAIPVQYYWIAIGWYGMFLIFIPVYMFLWLPIRLVLAGETTGFVSSASQIQWGLMAFAFGLSHLAYLLIMPSIPGTAANGRTLLLFLVFIVEISDVLQYIWGKTIGRHKILPTVSPNKTWEGFVGGIATTTLCSIPLRFLTPLSLREIILASFLITISGFLGGAVMSAMKRDFSVKDFGTMIPGHGGILDRVDSLCYAAPLFFHYVRYFYY